VAGAGPCLTESAESRVSACRRGGGCCWPRAGEGFGGFHASLPPGADLHSRSRGRCNRGGCADGSRAPCEYSPSSAGWSPLSARVLGPGAALGLSDLTSAFAEARPGVEPLCRAVPQAKVRGLQVLSPQPAFPRHWCRRQGELLPAPALPAAAALRARRSLLGRDVGRGGQGLGRCRVGAARWPLGGHWHGWHQEGWWKAGCPTALGAAQETCPGSPPPWWLSPPRASSQGGFRAFGAPQGPFPPPGAASTDLCPGPAAPGGSSTGWPWLRLCLWLGDRHARRPSWQGGLGVGGRSPRPGPPQHRGGMLNLPSLREGDGCSGSMEALPVATRRARG